METNPRRRRPHAAAQAGQVMGGGSAGAFFLLTGYLAATGASGDEPRHRRGWRPEPAR